MIQEATVALITRRAALAAATRGLLAAAPSLALSPRRVSASADADEIGSAEREAMGEVAQAFMHRFAVPGLSVAIARRGKLTYRQAFGWADGGTGEAVSTAHLFRIASVTKPITSVAIFTLVQQGKIRLDDKVFGKSGILGEKYGTPPLRRYVEDITVDHLLTHTCGGWPNDGDDPMFLRPRLEVGGLITWTLDTHPLGYPPGQHYAYSNFGYCLLGRVIEAITGQTYEKFVQQEVLAPCGVTAMRIAGNTLEERAPQEVIYYGQNAEDPYGMNVARMDSHGGWLATPTDLVRFATHVDGFTTTPNILRPDLIKVMTTASTANAKYARGWAVNELHNWWHTGSLPGTVTIMVRTSSGFCWAALANTRRQPDDEMITALDDLVWAMARKVSLWQL